MRAAPLPVLLERGTRAGLPSLSSSKISIKFPQPFHHKIEQSSARLARPKVSTKPRIMNQLSFSPLFDDQPMIIDTFSDMLLGDWPETEW